MTFQACLPIILASEGGLSDDPRDPGGLTQLGVTQRTLSDWLGHPATREQVRMLTPETVAPLYQKRYYNASHADACAPGVDLMQFDAAVNCGVVRAIRWLQTAAGVTADGIVGPATLHAVQNADAGSLIDKLASIREAYYRSLPTFATFGRGWLARVARTRAAAHKMAA